MRHFPLRFAFGLCLLAILVVWLAWHLHTRGSLPVAGDPRAEPAGSRGDEVADAHPPVLAGRKARCDVVIVVKASDGTALVEPYVRLVTPPEQRAQRSPGDRFRFPQLLPGTWDLEVRSRGLRGLDSQVVVPSPPPPTREVVVELSPYARVGGRVLTPDGRAADGARIQARYDGREWLRGLHGLDVSASYLPSQGTPVGADGYFRLEFLPVDVRVRVTATHAKFGAALAELTPRAGENDSITLTLGPSTGVRGRVPRLPRGARPKVFLFGVQGLSSEQQGVVTSEDDGVFLFEPVPPGSKAITAFLEQEDQVTMWHGRTSVVEGQSRDVGDLELGTGPDLVLRITAAPPVPQGAVAARVTGLLYLPARDGSQQETLFLQFDAALDGTVRIAGLPPGSLSLGASVGPSHRLGHVQVRSVDRAATPIDVLIPLRPPPVPQREVVITAAPPPGIAPTDFVGIAYVLRDGRPLIGSYMHQRAGRREWTLPVKLADTRTDLVSYCLGHGSMSGPVPLALDENGNGRARHERWQPAAQLVCRVRGGDGAPLKRVTLHVYKSATEEVLGEQLVAHLTSDDEGRAGCTLWPGEAYVIETFAEGFTPRLLRVAPESAVAGRTLTQDVDLVPAPR
jgi:hypothetical protein